MITRWERIRRQRQRELYAVAVEEARAAMMQLAPAERETVIEQLESELSPEERAQLSEIVEQIR